MKTILICLTLFVGQMNTLQDKPVVRLPPRQNFIPMDFGGDLVEIKSAPPTVQLPQLPPVLDSHGIPWLIAVINLGPGTVTIVGKAGFSVQVAVGKTVSIKSTSTGYSLLK